jgi:hypothetical protein
MNSTEPHAIPDREPLRALDVARFVAAVVGVCLVVAMRLGALLDHDERPLADPAARAPLTVGQCLDLDGRQLACESAWALYVVLGPRDMPGCSSAIETIVGTFEDGQTRRELAPWCIDLRARGG